MTLDELTKREKELQNDLQVLVQQGARLRQAMLITQGRLEEIQAMKKRAEEAMEDSQ